MDNVFGNDPALTDINGLLVEMDGSSYYMKDNCLFIDDVEDDDTPIQIFCIVSGRSSNPHEIKISVFCSSNRYSDLTVNPLGNEIAITLKLATDFNAIKHISKLEVPLIVDDTKDLLLGFLRLENNNSTTQLSYAKKQKHIIAYKSAGGTGLEKRSSSTTPNRPLNMRSNNGSENSQDGVLSIDDVDCIDGWPDTTTTPIYLVCVVHRTDPKDPSALEMVAVCSSNIYTNLVISPPTSNTINIHLTPVGTPYPSNIAGRKQTQDVKSFSADPNKDLEISFYQGTLGSPQSYATRQKHIILYKHIPLFTK